MTLSISLSRAVTMMTGTLERDRSCLHTSVPLIPGNMRSSSTMSAPARSNSARAEGPSATTVASKPSLRRRKARGSAKDSSSSTISTLVIDVLVLSFGKIVSTIGIVAAEMGGDGRGNRHRECRPGTRLTPQPNGAVVIGGDVFDDRQPEPGATCGPGPRLVDAEESFEHPLLIAGCDADTAVGDRDLDVLASPAAADRHR